MTAENKPKRRYVKSRRKNQPKVKRKRRLTDEQRLENRRKTARKYAKERTRRIRESGGVKITDYISAETKAQLRALCKATGLTQTKVLAAVIATADVEKVKEANPISAVAAARIAAVKRKLAALENKP